MKKIVSILMSVVVMMTVFMSVVTPVSAAPNPANHVVSINNKYKLTNLSKTFNVPRGKTIKIRVSDIQANGKADYDKHFVSNAVISIMRSYARFDYTVRDEKGRIVKSGVASNNKTVDIPKGWIWNKYTISITSRFISDGTNIKILKDGNKDALFAVTTNGKTAVKYAGYWIEY